MIVARTIEELRQALPTLPRPLGLVPTMGALHIGHVSLVERAKAENAAVALTIFVNPAQFGPNEDLERYPRPLERDLETCEQAGVSFVWVPRVDDVYPPGFCTWITVEGLSDRWEGARRPGHFRGVATVVARLLLLFLPERAYFGEKDYQQLQVIRRMVRDLAIPVEITGCQTIRDEDGLAFSSRNAYLSPHARQLGLALPRAIQAAVEAAANGTHDAAELERLMRLTAAHVDVDYLAVVDCETLEPVTCLDGPARVIGAIQVGTTRLLDNAAIAP